MRVLGTDEEFGTVRLSASKIRVIIKGLVKI